MSKQQKDIERGIVINNKTYTPEQRKRILKYCLDDVELTQKIFIEQVKDIEKKNKLETREDYETELSQILFRGASQLHVAKIEKAGIDIDYKKVNDFRKY